MRKVVVVAYEVEFLEEVDNLSNQDIQDLYAGETWDLVADVDSALKWDILAVLDAKEKADADETGITWGTFELDEGPFG